MSAVADAVGSGTLPGRVWMYSNYHCNLACSYCLTESAPAVARRALSFGQMRRIADDARGLGFDALGVTGGEPFLVPWMVDALLELSDRLPTVVLSNATLFQGTRLARMRELAGRSVHVQVSLDSATSGPNDEHRGAGVYAKVVDAVPRLVDLGVKVRIASTGDSSDQALCALHRSWGIPDEDHVVRPVIDRGRARVQGTGVHATPADLSPELTVTVDGAFWSPFGPTITGGRLDTDLLVTRTIDPLATAAGALLRLVEGSPPGADSALGIR